MITIGEGCSVKSLINTIKEGGYVGKTVRITIRPIIVGHEHTDKESLIIETVLDN